MLDRGRNDISLPFERLKLLLLRFNRGWIVLFWGDEDLPSSVNFFREVDMELVLKTLFNKPFTSLEFDRLVWVGMVWSPKSSSMLRSILLLNVIMDALLADYFTWSWAYFSKMPNFGTWEMQIGGSSLGIPHFGFMKGWSNISLKVSLLLMSTTKIFRIKSLAKSSLKDYGNSNCPFAILWYVFSTTVVSNGACPISIKYIMTPVLHTSTS